MTNIFKQFLKKSGKVKSGNVQN